MNVYHDIQSVLLEKPTVIAIGNFDGIHFGHKKIISHVCDIARKKKLTSLLITFWPHPRQVLQPNKMIQILSTREEKTEILTETNLDAVLYLPFNTEFAGMPYQEFISEYLVGKLNMKHLVLGYNHHFGKNREGNYENALLLTEKYNYTVDKLGPYDYEGEKVSSSLIRDFILKGEIIEANKFLGHDYFITGTVVHGDKIGKKIGFPTANIHVTNENKLIPKTGVYAVYAMVDEELFMGMLNIGIRPTVNTENKDLRIELNLFDFNKDIYGKVLRVYFKQRIRGEKKFDSLHQLKEQINQDKLFILSKLSLNSRNK